MQQYFLAYLLTYLLKGEMLWDPSKARRCAASCSRPVGRICGGAFLLCVGRRHSSGKNWIFTSTYEHFCILSQHYMYMRI